jgi:hypothetical protein
MYRVDRANIGTTAAIGAYSGVDRIIIITRCNGFNGTFIDTGPAGSALIFFDYISHDLYD